VDDVVLFAKPLQQDMEAIRCILQLCGEASGLHVNYAKSSATLIRGNEIDEATRFNVGSWTFL
jgi:hypothetical protein